MYAAGEMASDAAVVRVCDIRRRLVQQRLPTVQTVAHLAIGTALRKALRAERHAVRHLCFPPDQKQLLIYCIIYTEYTVRTMMIIWHT